MGLTVLSVVLTILPVTIVSAGPSDFALGEENLLDQPRKATGGLDEATRLHLLVIGYQSAEMFEDARNAFLQALEIAPGRVATPIGLAKLHFEEGDESSAQSTIEDAEEAIGTLSYFDQGPHHVVLGQAYLGFGNAEQAHRHFAEAERMANAIGSDQLLVRALISQAMANSQASQNSDADRLFAAARESLLEIHDETVQRNLRYTLLSEVANHLLLNNRFQEAHDVLNVLFDHVKGNVSLSVEVAYRQGQALIGLKQFDEAELLVTSVAEAYAEILGEKHSETVAVREDLKRLQAMKR